MNSEVPVLLMQHGHTLSTAASLLIFGWLAVISPLKMSLKPTLPGRHQAGNTIARRSVMSIAQRPESAEPAEDSPRNLRSRVLFIEDAEGRGITGPDGKQLAVNLTEQYNTDTQAPLMAVVRIQCDLGHWHRENASPLAVWSPDK